MDSDGGEDPRERWRDGLARAAAAAYQAAHGNPAPSEQRGTRWRLSGRVAASAALLLAVVVALAVGSGRAGAAPTVTIEEAPSVAPARVVVHVTGAVSSPGLVELPQGARVADAVAAAGGLALDADESGINLARPVVDGEQIYVPRRGEADQGGPVNINRASADDFEALPGIGPVLAARIVADRDRNGPFVAVDDLARVPGVGPSIIAGLDGLATA